MKISKSIVSILAIVAAMGIGYSASFIKPKPTKPITKPISSANSQENLQDQHEENASEGNIELSVENATAAGIEVSKVAFGTGSEIRILGRIMASPEAKVIIGAPISGRVTRVFVASGSIVNKGSPLFEIISAESVSMIADSGSANALANAAAANADAANRAYTSDQWLFQKGVISRRELDDSRANALSSAANVQGAHALASAAKAKIIASGSPASNGSLVVRAPINGVVSLMPVSIGGFVPQGFASGEITNTNNSEAVFQIAPALLEQVSIGSILNIESSSGKRLSGIIKAIVPGTDFGAANSIVRAKITGESLPIGLVISARIVSQAGGQPLKPIVPSAAIATFEDGHKVFIQTNSGFRAIPVIIGNSFNGQTEIIRGLSGNETVAIKNVFLLKSELLKSEVEHEH